MEKKPHVPDSILTLAFGAARLAEIKSIVKQLEDCDYGRRAFQTLPRHMQRRQVSSNPKRLPHYLREKHKREGGDNAKITRRPSRKYRRRPRNLLEEYNRRQKAHVWMETHIWHAKRFHMIKRWGYTLPDSSTFKGYRSSLRAAKTSCLAQDISYLCCIELEGKHSTLLSGLSRITQPIGLASLKQPKVQQGQQWDVVTFFKPDRQPYGALGDVDILWLPSISSSSETQVAKLWIWVHPSAHNHVIEALVDIYELVKTKNVAEINLKEKEIASEELVETKGSDTHVNAGNRGSSDHQVENVSALDVELGGEYSNAVEGTVETSVQNNSKKRKSESQHLNGTKKRLKRINETKLATRNIPFERTPKYYSNSTCISMTLLKDTLSRFRLTGPKTIDVLRAAFLPANLSCIKSNDANTVSGDQNANKPWWEDYYCNKDKQRCHENQTEAWEKLPAVHPEDRVVFPLTVRDPRVTLPDKKSPIDPAKDKMKKVGCRSWPVDSPIYVSELRDKISLSKEPDSVINDRRSQLLVPGSKLPECPEEFRLPLLMLSRPCTHSTGYGVGWDVIVCSGWGMSVWMPIIFNGGVAGGQQAAENLLMEFITPETPNLLPDTIAGDYYSVFLSQERHREFFKRPPACRANFIKLGVQYPFSSPWKKLVQDWVMGTQDIFVLRKPELMNYLVSHFGDAFDRIRRSNGSSGRSVDTTLKVVPVQSLDLPKTKDTGISTNLQDCKFENADNQKYDGTSCEHDAEKELQQSKHGCLVKVKLVLEKKGTLESCAMICLPLQGDIQERFKETRPGDNSGIIMEPAHIDTQHEQREKLKAEHGHIKRKIRLLKTKAKLKVEKEVDVTGVTERGENFKKLTEKALENVQESNKVLFSKHTSYNSDMENLWLMRRDEPLQCCSRKIMGYVTHGNFSMTIGQGAGIGWVALKPLLDCLQLYRELQDLEPVTKEESDDTEREKTVKVKSVLVRNPSSLQYHWATLFIVR